MRFSVALRGYWNVQVESLQVTLAILSSLVSTSLSFMQSISLTPFQFVALHTHVMCSSFSHAAAITVWPGFIT